MVPDFNGTVTLSTQGSTYDTILAVYTGQCGTLNQIACNDDNNYFTSMTNIQVRAGEEYYIEVADWHSSASGDVNLSILSVLQPITSHWEVTSSGADTESFRSRHVVVADGSKLYVIGGQTVIGSNSVRTPTTCAYDTTDGSVDFLQNMRVSDGLGYSNTTGALVNGRIYIPSGYVGDDFGYDGTHVFYDIAAGRWSEASDNNLPAPNNWVGGTPSIYSQATVYSFNGPPGAGYFLSGGLTGPFPTGNESDSWTPRSELYFYSVDDDNWTLLNPPMSTGRFGHVAGLQSIKGKDHLCVAGGMGGVPGTSRDVLNSTLCYDIDLGTWSEFASLNYARYFATSAVDSAGNWYILGGYDHAGNPLAFTERYDRVNDQWVPLEASFNVGIANPSDPQAFANPPRAWSRGAYVGTTMWIVGGEARSQQVINLVQRATLFRGNEPTYMPVVKSETGFGRRYDTFSTAGALAYGGLREGRFLTTDDIVDIYRFHVPWSQQIRIRLTHLGQGNELDLVVYDDDKSHVISGRQPGTATEELTVWLSAGTYFAAVERVFPILGINPSSAKYLLQVGPDESAQ
jgi:hypothetical protein